MRSMTAFGRASASGSFGSMEAEIKSYNSRYLDLFVYLPQELAELEPWVREEAGKRLHRGKVEISGKIKAQNGAPLLHREAASAFAALLKQLKQNGLEPFYSLNDLERQGVFSKEEPQALKEAFQDLFLQAFDSFIGFKAREGRQTAEDMKKNVGLIEERVQAIAALAPQAAEETEKALRLRFKEIAGKDIEERRLLEETAAWIVRIDINEETVRLQNHLQAVRSLLTEKAPIGRKLDFLCQELNREINTIGNKTPHLQIQHHGIWIKDAIEKIREQARNVE